MLLRDYRIPLAITALVMVSGMVTGAACLASCIWAGWLGHSPCSILPGARLPENSS